MGLIYRVLLFLLVSCHLSEVIGVDKTVCSPISDRVIRRGKCRYCPPCDVGKGRNFTKTVEQIENLDLTKCLPCEKCPDGSFNDGLGFKSSCRPCTSDMCFKLNRDIQRQCTSTSDQICGSCIHGYNDDFHRDHKQPCLKDITSSTVRRTIATQGSNTVSPMPFKTPQQGNVGQVRGQNGQKNYDPKVLIIAILLPVCVVLVCLLVVITWRCYKPRGTGCPERVIENGTCASSMTTLDSSENESSSLIEDKPPQTDGPLQDGKTQKKVSHDARSNVRGELHSYNGPTQNGMAVSDQLSDHRAMNDRPYEKCGCSFAQCSSACEVSSIDDHVVNKEDPILNLIACRICHDPHPFFKALEMEDCEIYNLENDRDRAPEKISQKEFIRSVLNRWVEVKGSNATYGRIRRALCAGNFHRINYTLLPRQ